ncbi:MAG: catalase family protein [Spirochaetota bacterium]
MKEKLSILLLLVFLFTACGGPYVKIPEDTKLGTEFQTEEEELYTEKTVKLVLSRLDKDYPKGTKMRRDAHPKHHGCVLGSFRVNKDVPEEFKHGIFQNEKSYSTWIRISNGSIKPKEDSKGDIRGFALKLTGVEGEKILSDEKNTQDFLLINHPVLPVGSPKEYYQLFEAAFRGSPASYIFGWNPFSWKLNALSIVRKIRSKKISNMLDIRYWSTTPYRLGKYAVKYSVKPCHTPSKAIANTTKPNYLREVMVAHLQEKEACFDFMVQKQVHPTEMPVEDPAVVWDEEKSPFVKLAQIHIKQQKFDSKEQMDFCENLSFSPWHSKPEHKPLGGINRVRKVVYEKVSQFRHERNAVERKEPTGKETFAKENK